MNVRQRIRETFLRNARAVALRPAFGRGTAVTRVRLREGLACEVEDGRWRLSVDMSEKTGGAASAPDPGVMGRAALGSCLAIGYAQEAAVRGIELKALEVEVQADYDARAELGLPGAEPGYVQVRCVVTVESDAPRPEILAMLDEVDARSPYLAVFTRPQDVRREVRFGARER